MKLFAGKNSRVETLAIDCLQFSKFIIATNGYVFGTVEKDTTYADSDFIYVLTKGSANVAGTVHTDTWVSLEDANTLHYGPFQIQAVTDTEVWQCRGFTGVSNPVSVINVTSSLVLNAGDNILMLTGTLSFEGRTFSSPSHIKASRSITLTGTAAVFKWDATSLQVQYSRNELNDAKLIRWNLLKSIRTLKDNSGFMYLGQLYDSDAAAQVNISGAAQAAALNSSFTIGWVTADNSVQQLNSAEMIGLGLALANHRGTNHAISTALRNQIEAATTIAEVNAIQWPV